MAQYLGTVKLGGFYNNGAILKRPTKPWRPDSDVDGNYGVGDIPQMSGSMANYTFGNTPSADANKLQWVKIKDGDKTLLICDRVILVSVSWDDLNSQGYITGKTVTIDGAKYKCRVLTGGSNRRNGDSYAGGTPTNNEWTGSSPARRSSRASRPRSPPTWTTTSTRPTKTARITSFGTGMAFIPGARKFLRIMRRIVRTVGTTRPAAGVGTSRPIGTRPSVSAPSLKS